MYSCSQPTSGNRRVIGMLTSGASRVVADSAFSRRFRSSLLNIVNFSVSAASYRRLANGSVSVWSVTEMVRVAAS